MRAAPCLVPWIVMVAASAVASEPVLDTRVDLSTYVPQQSRAGQDSDLAVAVALSGGGLRASNFAIGALVGLEAIPTRDGNLLSEVDYFSTTSGGGFAAAFYLAARLAHRGNPEATGSFSFVTALEGDEHLRQALIGGYGKALVAAGCKTYKLSRDRGHGFEKILDESLVQIAGRGDGVDEGRRLLLGELFMPAGTEVEPERLLPFWVANATVSDDASLFLFAPDVISRARIKEYVHRCETVASRDAFQVPWSMGLKASASLPGVIPATVLKSELFAGATLRLIDGGVADNQGIISAVEMLLQDRKLGKRPPKRSLLVVVDAFRSAEPTLARDDDARVALTEGARVPVILKAAQRLGYRRLVTSLCETNGIELVYIDFGDIPTSPLREGARNIATDLSISAEERELLWRAGRAAVATRTPTLRGLTRPPKP